MGIDISQIPPELLQELIGSGSGIGNAQDDVARQTMQANLMRSMGGNATNNGQGQTVRNGIFVAGSPLSALAGVGGTVGGMMKDAGAADSMKKVRTAQEGQFQKVLEALMKQKMLQAGGQPTPPVPPMQANDMNNPAAMGMSY